MTTGQTAAHVFVDDLERPELSPPDAHHLGRVLRLRRGELVSASDGEGAGRLCRWTGAASLEKVGAVARSARPLPVLTVAVALTKGARTEWAVQKLTEAGVDRVVLMTSERCVVRWVADSEERHLQHLRSVARQAAMQSRRVWLPAVEGPARFGSVVAGGDREAAEPGTGAGRSDQGVALATPGGSPLTLATPTVLVGPEGGWADAELAAVERHAGVGPHILRSETAALAAGVLLAALRAGLVAPGAPAPAGRPVEPGGP